MARDFGGKDVPAWRPGRRLAYLREAGSRAGLVAAFILFASLPTMMVLSGGGPEKPPKAEGGPACRPISKAAFLRGWKAAPRVIHYQGVAFARRRGDAFCGMGRDGLLGRSFPVCELDAPVEIGVTVGGRETYFDVGPGYTAVVEVRPDGPRCTITGRYRMWTLSMSARETRSWRSRRPSRAVRG